MRKFRLSSWRSHAPLPGDFNNLINERVRSASYTRYVTLLASFVALVQLSDGITATTVGPTFPNDPVFINHDHEVGRN